MNNTLKAQIEFSPDILITEEGCWTVLLTEVAGSLWMEPGDLIQRFGLAYSVDAAILTFRNLDLGIVYIGMFIEGESDIPLLSKSQLIETMLGTDQPVRVPLFWVQNVFRLIQSGAERLVLKKERIERPDKNTDKSILYSFRDAQDNRWVHVVAQDKSGNPVRIKREWTL